MAKNIVVFTDGTWNDPTCLTNVYQLFHMLTGGDDRRIDRDADIDGHLVRHDEQESNQIAYYLNGVGARGTHEEILGGTMGFGLHARVLDGYMLISRAYEPGDKIYLFGFSRGAYTARSLGGLIASTGLLPRRRRRPGNFRADANRRWWQFKHGTHTLQPDAPDRDDPAPIALIGVWETVGALGIPFFNGVQAFDRFEKKFFDFANQDLSPRVQRGRQALAIDETRADFKPTLWNAREGIKQRWFVGVHSDVGGGYSEHGLSDNTLQWMIGESEPLGLRIKSDKARELRPDIFQDRHDEVQKHIWQLRPHGPRHIPSTAHFDDSVGVRMKRRQDYRPAPLLTFPQFAPFFTGNPPKEDLIPPDSCGPAKEIAVGEAVTVEVFAAQWWNATGLRVSAAETYQVTATSKWTDGHYTADANGYEKRKLNSLRWARRVPDARWFCLIASVAPDPTLETHDPSFWKGMVDIFTGLDSDSRLRAIGESGTISAERNGYLYLFANDAASAYANNSGSVVVEVKRTQ